MLRVAVIGVGSMGYHHARNYAELPDTRLVAVADTNAEQGRQVAGRFGCLFYHSHQDMLDRERLDAVSLAVPTSQHYRIACDLIDAGVSLLVEKPLAGNVAEAAE
ncbi:MAG: Gfo/Idh/MocA family oxidoreductase, partial [Chloroflexi bacterium]|nr:Gfo/Idh/MocA family oxidoreductase [Chloroflexota bacterium]